MKAYTLVGLAAIVIGCGGSNNRNNNEDSGCRPCITQDAGSDNNSYDVYDAGTDSGNDTNNGMDSGTDSNDSGIDNCCDVSDGGVDSSDEDSGRINNPPIVELIYEPGHPLAGEVYNNRTVKRGRDTDYVARGSDPDGDVPLEYRFRFSDGFFTMTGENRISYNLSENGRYTLDVSVVDSRGLEGTSYRANLDVVDNIPPVAKLRCEERDPIDELCVYRMRTWEDVCVDGSDSYDEDGMIRLYIIEPTVGGFTSSGADPVRCMNGGPDPGTFMGRYHVEDDETLRNYVDFRTIVTE